MFNETNAPGPAPVMVYNPGFSAAPRSRGRMRDRTRLRGQQKACCASCAQKGLSGLSGCGCSPMEVIVIQEPTSDTQATTTGDLPGWVWLAALGVGALLLLK